MRRVAPSHKSWYVSAPIVTFNARRIATQTWQALHNVLDGSINSGTRIESELGSRQLHQQRVPPNTSQKFAPI